MSTRAAGFTLVETLVVVALIAIVAATVSVNLAGGTRSALRTQAETLAGRLAHAQDEALVTGTRLAWRAEEGGYRFLRGRDEGWEAVERDDALRAVAWHRGVRLGAVERPARGERDAGTLVFRASGLNDPYRVVLEDAAQIAVIESDGVRLPTVRLQERR